MQIKLLGAITSYSEKSIPDDLYLPAYTLSPEEIFKGDILLFDVNFFEEGKKPQAHYKDKKDKDGNVQKDAAGNTIQEVEYYYYINDKGEEVKTSQQNMAVELRGVVSKWYVSLRNIALVGMLIVLLYVGIRMLLSTVASDKAKYKQMIYDWLVGMLLLILMHYIMAFSVKLVEKVTDIIETSMNKKAYYALIPISEDSGKASKFKEFVKEANLQDGYVDANGNKTTDENAAKGLIYPTNLMGYIRMDVSLAPFGTEYIGKGLCFVVLAIMTLFFVFTYLRRVLYMAFLTIIAPMVALTYPIDKLNDGSAQGFDKWFKEYIFNLLLQPVHLILYYVLISSAWDLSSKNMIYSLVALGFMIPAEKLLRNFFGFEKAHTPGLLAGPAGAAMMMQGLKSLSSLSKGRKDSSSKNNKLGSGENNENSSNPRLNGDVDEGSVFGDDNNDTESIPASNESEDSGVNPMLAAYDENYGTDEWDAHERDALARENNNNRGMQYSDDEYRQILRESGYTEDEIRQEMGDIADNLEDENNSTNNSRLTLRDRASNIKNKAKKGAKRTLKRAKRSLVSTGKYRLASGATKGLNKGIRMTGAIVGGSLGLAAGIVSGDPKQAIQYSTLAAGAGMKIADSTPEILTLEKASDRISEKREQVKNSRKYEELNKEIYMNSQQKEIKKALKANFDKDEVKKIMANEKDINSYIENGLSADEVVTAERMRKDDRSLKTKELILAAKHSKAMGSDYDGPKSAEWESKVAQSIQRKTGKSLEQAQRDARTAMDRVGKFNKIKKTNYK